MSVVAETSRFDVVDPAEFVAECDARGVSMFARVVAVGNPGWNVFSVVEQWVRDLPPETLLLVPDEKGAARVVIRAAVKHAVPVAVFPALWRVSGSQAVNVRAGYARSALMLMLGAHELVAFTSSVEKDSPLRDVMMKAYCAGLTVRQIDSSGSGKTFQRQDGASVSFQMLAVDAKFAYEVPDVDVG